MFKKKRFSAVVSLALAAVLTLGLVGCGGDSDEIDDSNNPNNPNGTTETVEFENASATEITGGYEKGSSRATQTSEYLGTVDKVVKPVAGIKDEHETYGISNYPSWGHNLKGFTVEERNGIFKESKALAPYPTWKSANIYDAIDAEGYLLRNGQRVKYTAGEDDSGDDEEEEGDVISGGFEEEDGEEVEEGSTATGTQYKGEYRMLYKHSASVGMYGGDVSDDEPRIIKKVTAITRSGFAATQITGLYAPAGEVIKVQISEADLKNAGSIRVYIGQNYNLDQHVSMETSGNGIKGSGFSRMSDILSIFQISPGNATLENGVYTAYVGSFLGGPIYFRANGYNSKTKRNNHAIEKNISVTFSGGVKYQHFILGVTTPEEYELNKNTTAPYFDLEVYDAAVRFTTTRYTSSGGLALKDYTYEDCTNAAILWDKISQVSKRVAANGLTAGYVPVNIIGDCYIAAGAAFANPGRNGVVCPPSWLAEALNYNKFVNGGCWGTMHEYNHCWQGYGFGNGGEVTNNATTLVAYSLYTRISQSRTAATGWGNGSWNRFTDPSKSLGELLTTSGKGGKSFDLAVYASLLHNIGQDNFITAARGGREAQSGVYYNNLVNATHYDMTYFVTKVLNYNVAETGAKGTLPQATVNAVKEKNYPTFVPVASVYQVGRSIEYDGEKKDIITAQPFSYGTGSFIMDFNNKNNFAGGKFNSKALVIPDGFTVTVKSVTQPQNGKVELQENNRVKYTPKDGKDSLYSGNFRVTLGIVKDDGAFEVNDVDLIINLKQGTSTTLNRTTYVYENETDVPETNAVYNAASNVFDFGNYSSTECKKNVCTQEANTQIWAAGRNYDDDTYNKDSTNYRVMPNNKTIQMMEGVMYFSGAGTYRFTLKGRGKATLYLSYDGGENWQNALSISRTSGNAYIESEYAEHEFTTKNNYVYFKVVLAVTQESDFFGIGVASKNADGTFSKFGNAENALTMETAEVDKAIKEESTKKFQTEYRYKNEYTYSYSNSDAVPVTQNTLVSVSHEPWDNTRLIDFLFDGQSNTYYHSKKGVAITEAKPFELVVDLGKLSKVNTATFNGYTGDKNNNGMVKTFKLYGSTDGEEYFLLTDKTNSPATSKAVFSFDDAEIRYYKLVVTDTYSGNHYFAMNSIVFSYNVSFADGFMIAPNDGNVKYTGTWGSKNVLCNFGIIYTSGVGDYVEYTFTGTRAGFAAYQSADYGTVDVYIDGQLVAADVDLSAEKNVGAIAFVYSGDALESGEHTLKIVGKSGAFNIDSFVYWN